MCLPMDSCFGFGAPRTDDDNYHAPAAASRTQQPHGQRNGGSHYSGNSNGAHYNGSGYPAQTAAEAASKASNDARRDHAHVVPDGGWHGHGHGHAASATGAQEKMAAVYPHAGADRTLKQQPAAPNGRFTAADGARGGAQRNNYYYEPAHKEDAADSYYLAATATADHERY